MPSDLEMQIREIQKRNGRVEAEKAWETSFTRRAFIALLTYVISALILWSLGLPYPFLQAFIPAGGYLFSTISIPWIKNAWMRKYLSKR